LKQLGDRWGLQTVLAVVGLIDQTLVRIRHSVYSRVLLESTLIQICNLPDLQHISDLAAAASDAALPSNQKKKPALAPPKTSPRSDGPTAESRRREPAAAQQANQTNSQPNNDTPPRGTAPDLQGSTTGLPTTQTEATGQSRNQAGTAEASLSERSVPSQTEDEKSANDKTSAASTSTDQGNPQHDIGAASPWTQPEAQRVWQAALGDLESMTEAFARMVSKVVAVGTQQLRLEFPANGNLAMRRCELPEHRSTILQAVSKRAGRDITLEYYLAESDTAPKKSVVTSNKPSRIQRMREIEANELVRSCIDLFNAEIVRIDKAN
jgi:DNA polymerase-3 subunit gamma/tau